MKEIFIEKNIQQFTEEDFFCVEAFKEKALELCKISKESLFRNFLISNGLIKNNYEIYDQKVYDEISIEEDNAFITQIQNYRHFFSCDSPCNFVNFYNTIYVKFKDKNLQKKLSCLLHSWKNSYFYNEEKKDKEINIDELIKYYFNTKYFHINEKTKYLTKLKNKKDKDNLIELFKITPDKVLEISFFHFIQFKISLILKLYDLIKFLEKDSQFLIFSLEEKDFNLEKNKIYNMPYNEKIYIINFFTKKEIKYEKINLDF